MPPKRATKVAAAPSGNVATGTNKSIEEKYQSMTQEEHILARPDTYVGDIQPQTEPLFVFEDETNQIIKKPITHVPGLYKIFDEILVNASDQKQIDPSMDCIMVEVDKQSNQISVYNNGKGIDVELHSEHGIYVPELIFGKLLTSTNYDDTEQRTTGGRNGYGAKLTNIFSQKFIVETVDFARKRKFTQEFTENMTQRTKPIVENLKVCKNGYTKITFVPDFVRFKQTGLTDDMISLIKKRTYDLAGTTIKCNVFYNGTKINIKDFKSYISLYRFEGMPESDDDSDTVSTTSTVDEDKTEEYKLFYETVNNCWEIGFMYAPDCGGEQISFVNGICTYHGGSHVDYVINMVINKLKELVAKKFKDIVLKPSQIKENLIVFIKSTIVNPAFTSQTKETLKTKSSEFGSECNIKDQMLTKFSKSGILSQIINMIKLKEQAILKKTDGKKVSKISGIPKLEDANKAGSKDSASCSLVLTEGDSAKALAMSGRSVTGSDRIGVFPLKGKLLNVREATPKQLLENEEIINIKKIMGFQHEKEYTDISSLRYGRIIIMCDQDVDGFHIKGLLLNFVHYFWPSLLKIPNFITSLATPIVKATKGKEQMIFYNLSDYETWKSTSQGNWSIKYYKGLGTSTSAEAKEYFTDIESKLINYLDDKIVLKDTFIDPESEDEDNDEGDEGDEGESSETEEMKTLIKVNGVKPKHKDGCTESITLAFEKKRADDRKTWLRNYNKNNVLNNSQKKVMISEFINKELIHFSDEDIKRSIPGFDGLKPSQRKVLYGTILKKLFAKKDEIRVAQLAGFVSEKTCYHHGEASLTGTIIGMAQNYVGSNNINLLFPSGQFGTRLVGTGKDAASPRYIYTYLAELTRLIFRPEDEPILKYLEDDGIQIEPEYFVPIIPMALINGPEGIGTGFSTKIPCFNPLTVIDNLLAMIEDKPVSKMNPWYKNFKGTIMPVQDKPNDYLIYGVCSKVDSNHIRVSELPIGYWTTDYKEFLDGLEAKQIINNYTANNTEEIVDFVIEIDDDKLTQWLQNGSIYVKLGLITKKSTSNMHLYNAEGKIVKYKTPLEVLEDFYDVRYDTYVKRKEHLIGKLTEEMNILTYKMKFIQDVLNKKIIIERTKKQVIIDRLIELKYPMMANDEANESYNYLINIPLMSLSDEKIKELEDRCNAKEQELINVRKTSEEQMWSNELLELRSAYIKWNDAYKIETTVVNQNKAKGKVGKETIKETIKETPKTKQKPTPKTKSVKTTLLE